MRTRLYRNKENKVIAGVCSGLSDYFDVDVVIIRVIFLATAFAWGISFIIYVFFWIAMPIRKDAASATENVNASIGNPIDADLQLNLRKRRKSTREVLAIVLIVTGVFATLDNLFHCFSLGLLGPVVLITIGLLVLFYGSRGESISNEETKNE